jgi:hypothetical protein
MIIILPIVFIMVNMGSILSNIMWLN